MEWWTQLRTRKREPLFSFAKPSSIEWHNVQLAANNNQIVLTIWITSIHPNSLSIQNNSPPQMHHYAKAYCTEQIIKMSIPFHSVAHILVSNEWQPRWCKMLGNVVLNGTTTLVYTKEVKCVLNKNRKVKWCKEIDTRIEMWMYFWKACSFAFPTWPIRGEDLV